MRHFLQLFIFSFLIWKAEPALAQSPQDDYLQSPVTRHDFDRDKWKSLTKDLDYSKDPPEEKEKVKPDSTFSTDLGRFAQVVKVVFVLVGIALLVFILVKMAGGQALFSPRNRKLQTGTGFSIEDIEANLLEAELDDPIRRAIAAGDFALAVRLYYLAILKELSLKKRIQWKREKTNGEYLRELSGTSLFVPVKEATLIFERIWYGKTNLDRESFLKVEGKFKEVTARIA